MCPAGGLRGGKSASVRSPGAWPGLVRPARSRRRPRFPWQRQPGGGAHLLPPESGLRRSARGKFWAPRKQARRDLGADRMAASQRRGGTGPGLGGRLPGLCGPAPAGLAAPAAPSPGALWGRPGRVSRPPRSQAVTKAVAGTFGAGVEQAPPTLRTRKKSPEIALHSSWTC